MKKLLAWCPKDPTHKKFITSAHVVEEWLVDSKGDFLENRSHGETVHGPDTGNTWACDTCGAEAVFLTGFAERAEALAEFLSECDLREYAAADAAKVLFASWRDAEESDVPPKELIEDVRGVIDILKDWYDVLVADNQE